MEAKVSRFNTCSARERIMLGKLKAFAFIKNDGFSQSKKLVSKHTIGKVILRAIECINYF